MIGSVIRPNFRAPFPSSVKLPYEGWVDLALLTIYGQLRRLSRRPGQKSKARV